MGDSFNSSMHLTAGQAASTMRPLSGAVKSSNRGTTGQTATTYSLRSKGNNTKQNTFFQPFNSTKTS